MTTSDQATRQSSARPERAAAEGSVSLSHMARHAWQIVGLVLAAVAIGWLIQTVIVVFVALVLALMISATMAPLLRRLTKWGWNPTLGALTVTMAWIGLFLILFAAVGWRMVDQLPDLVEQLTRALERLRLQFPALPIAEDGQINQLVDQISRAARQQAVANVEVAAEVVTGGLLTVVLSFFFLRDGKAMWDWFVGQFNDTRRRRVDAMGRAGYATLSEYVRGLAVIAAVDAVLSGIGLFVLDVPLALALAVLTFIAGFIPTVGALIAGGLAVSSAFVAGGTTLAVIVAVLYTLIQQLDGAILQPWIMGRRLPLHPAGILVALTIGGLVGGIPGALLSVPVTAAVVAATSEYVNPGTYRPPLW